MVGLTNDKRCLVHNLRVEKHWVSERIMEMFSNECAHLNCEQLIANIKIVQTLYICGVFFMALYLSS